MVNWSKSRLCSAHADKCRMDKSAPRSDIDRGRNERRSPTFGVVARKGERAKSSGGAISTLFLGAQAPLLDAADEAEKLG